MSKLYQSKKAIKNIACECCRKVRKICSLQSVYKFSMQIFVSFSLPSQRTETVMYLVVDYKVLTNVKLLLIEQFVWNTYRHINEFYRKIFYFFWKVKLLPYVWHFLLMEMWVSIESTTFRLLLNGWVLVGQI